ncbi:uncharacterized protein Triagg1_973 [Trichoderma aggressivum f. europaeum]|uniref:Uncharacterized protein n=1 Tax=Trichoderma aggressivum f. europaeum TaxID=173218 RepID=A0AAE1ILC0_9HYPO|nr:hypothetical protein Triagg1_973 [Trichoderma aggressivum f. europaeum]
MHEHQKKSKIYCCAAASETCDGKANERDDEAEYYEEIEDEDGDGDGQDCIEDKQQHREDRNEEQNEKAKEHLANQQACAHDFDRIKLHDVQIRSLKDRCAHIQENYRIEKQARMDSQQAVEKLMQTIAKLQETVEKLQETIQNQKLKNKQNKETIKKCNIRLDALETDDTVFREYFRQIAKGIVELRTAVFGPEESQS